MGCLKLSYYQRGTALGEKPKSFLRVVGKKAGAPKKGIDYYAFGSQMPGRNYSTPSYRYGFNGMEKDDEIKGISGSSYDFGARIYDSRLGRWLAIDPLYKKYPFASPYGFALDNPILFKDYDGKDIEISNNGEKFIYSSRNSTYSGSNEFIAESVKGLNHLRTYEAESDAKYKVVTKLANDKTVLAYLTEVPINERPDGVGSAKWNPKQGAYIRDQRTGKIAPQSPAGTLEHEMGHEFDRLYPEKGLSETLPVNATRDQIYDYADRDEASPYGLLEEGVITLIETPYYKYYGQATRVDHDTFGFFEVIGGFTSNQECVTCGTNNQGGKEAVGLDDSSSYFNGE